MIPDNNDVRQFPEWLQREADDVLAARRRQRREHIAGMLLALALIAIGFTCAALAVAEMAR